MTSMRLNPPPDWPPVPPGWVPPPGWRPDPSWPDPPPGWNLWVEDTAARQRQIRYARWTIAGGCAAFLGSLLPFLSYPQPNIYTVDTAPKKLAALFGVILAVLGTVMLAKSNRAKLVSGILALVIAGLAVLTLGGFILAGIVGTDETDPVGGPVHIHFSPQIGMFVSILGCVAAGTGALISLRRRSSAVAGDEPA